MEIRKTWRQVARRPEFGAFFVARLTGIGRLDPGVADQAIRHLREVRAGHLAGFLHAAMAGAARISAIAAQLPADVARRLQVPSAVDHRGDEGRHVAHFQVQRVVEMSHPGGRRTRDDGVLVALPADLFGGKKVVLDAGARERRPVARGALHFELEVQAMRKGRRQGRAPREPKKR